MSEPDTESESGTAPGQLSPEQLAEIERKYDPELAFRPTGKILAAITTVALVAMSAYFFYASGFGLVRELLHRGIYLSFVLGLALLMFAPRRGDPNAVIPKPGWYRFDGVSYLDIALCIVAIAASLYLPLLPPEIVSERVGNPSQIDVFMGTILLIVTLEATRRSVGPTLPVISIIFMLFALFGRYMPGALNHSGTSWLGLVNHLYMTNQGIYGIAVGVMAQYVFLFVLFGVLATRIGLGQLFIDLATVIAGRYSGGPAKVAIFSSALLGSISGSSIANTVTTGSLTISGDEARGLSRAFCRGRGGDRIDGRTDHASGSRRRRLCHGRIPPGAAAGHSARVARSSDAPLFRHLHHGPPRGAQTRAARPQQGRAS